MSKKFGGLCALLSLGVFCSGAMTMDAGMGACPSPDEGRVLWQIIKEKGKDLKKGDHVITKGQDFFLSKEKSLADAQEKMKKLELVRGSDPVKGCTYFWYADEKSALPDGNFTIVNKAPAAAAKPEEAIEAKPEAKKPAAVAPAKADAEKKNDSLCPSGSTIDKDLYEAMKKDHKIGEPVLVRGDILFILKEVSVGIQSRIKGGCKREAITSLRSDNVDECKYNVLKSCEAPRPGKTESIMQGFTLTISKLK